MAGFTDKAFRALAARLGATDATTEMVSAKATVYGDEKTLALAALAEDEPRTALQLFGHEPDDMAVAVRRLLTEADKAGRMPAAVDLNMGCPVKKIITSGDGSALMRDPALCGALVAAAKDAANAWNIPVTVKMRTGWNAESKNAVAVAKEVAAAGAAAVTVHGRTREEMYRPGIDYAVIAAVRDALPANIPVIGNGDIASPEDARRMLTETGCDGIMIGRAALGNPWLFAAIRKDLAGETFVPPTKEEKLGTALALLRRIIAEKGDEALAVRECRGRLSPFLTGMRGCAAARDLLHRAVTYGDVERALETLGETYGGFLKEAPVPPRTFKLFPAVPIQTDGIGRTES